MKITFEIDDKDIKNCLETISSAVKGSGVDSPEFFSGLQSLILSAAMTRQRQANEAAAKRKNKAQKAPKPKQSKPKSPT